MSSLTADKESPQVTGTAVVWTAVASDAENDPLQYQFSMDGQLLQDWSRQPRLELDRCRGTGSTSRYRSQGKGWKAQS